MKKITVMIALFMMVVLLSGCQGYWGKFIFGTNDNQTEKPIQSVIKHDKETTITGEKDMKNPIITFTLENDMVINIELYPDVAPNTVNNFISLIRKGYFDGLIFHRIIDGFMIQGGCPDGTGMGGPGYNIPGEFSDNGFKNDLKHVPGVISMARGMAPDSAGSQFFLMVADSPHLDGTYAGFGKTVDEESLNNVLKLGKTQVTGDRPENPPVIKTVTVDAKGVEYDEPKYS